MFAALMSALQRFLPSWDEKEHCWSILDPWVAGERRAVGQNDQELSRRQELYFQPLNVITVPLHTRKRDLS